MTRVEGRSGSRTVVFSRLTYNLSTLVVVESDTETKDVPDGVREKGVGGYRRVSSSKKRTVVVGKRWWDDRRQVGWGVPQK